jgi:hypothetical protein
MTLEEMNKIAKEMYDVGMALFAFAKKIVSQRRSRLTLDRATVRAVQRERNAEGLLTVGAISPGEKI